MPVVFSNITQSTQQTGLLFECLSNYSKSHFQKLKIYAMMWFLFQDILIVLLQSDKHYFFQAVN